MTKMGINIVLFLCIFGLKTLAFEGKFEDRFNHYETLHYSSIHHEVVKRSVHIPLNAQVISLSTLGRHFKLHLQTARGLFSPDFIAIEKGEDNEERKIDVDTREFYEGYVEGEPNSHVHAHWENDDLSAIIETEGDTYVVEPSWRFLPFSNKFSMISYKMSDMKEKAKADMGKSFCGYVHPDHDDANSDHYVTPKTNYTGKETSDAIHGRKKRQSNNKKVCEVALVADYHFFIDVGLNSKTATINYMVDALTTASNVFKTTSFKIGSNTETGYSMQIKQVVVNTAATPVSGGALHYNMQVNSGKNWDVKTLLTLFSKQDWSKVCLAHLFTHQDFADGVLGLGWIASATAGTTGGICSTKTGDYYYSTAFSSTMNSGGNRLSKLEANLVVTHEFGHNWGSPHDPSSCAPSSTSGGKFIMYQYAVNGYEANNNKFSTCSINTMSSVLVAKKDQCFVDPSAEICGNGIVEAGEQCDAGSAGLAGQDQCCAPGCRFNAKYRCSDSNHVCCFNCAFAGSSKQCGFSGSYASSCQENVFCDGTSKDCPTAVNKPNNSSCGDLGDCQNGVCQSYCEVRGELDCQCQDILLDCKRCCKPSSSGICAPYDSGNSVYSNQPDGKPCLIGYCSSGECTRQVTTNSQRTWNVISNLTTDGILAFMRSNIVLVTVVLTLVIYIPAVIIVLCIDWRNDADDDDELDWHNKENDKLLRDDANTVIRPTYTRRRIQPRGGRGANRGDAGSEHGTRISSSGVNVGNL